MEDSSTIGVIEARIQQLEQVKSDIEIRISELQNGIQEQVGQLNSVIGGISELHKILSFLKVDVNSPDNS